MKRCVLFLLILALAGLTIPGFAQTVFNSKSGMVQYIEGEVFIDEKALPEPLISQFPYVNEGSVLRTGEGRAEVIMNPGLTLRVGENSSFKLIGNRFIDTRVDLTAGSATVQVFEVLKDNSFTVVCGNATITLEKAGVYHFYTNPARLKVFAGEATAKIGGEVYEVTSGKVLNFGGALASLEKFNKDEADSLDRWTARRGELMAAANASAAKGIYDSVGRRDPCYSRTSSTNYLNGAGYVSSADPCVGTWRYNPHYGMWTYIPINGRLCDPIYGYCLYNPVRAYDTYYRPPVVMPPPSMGGGGYATMPQTSGGYSGSAAAVSSSVSTSSSAGSGATAAAAASASSTGRGSADGGSRGK